jgi:hypothetical protein
MNEPFSTADPKKWRLAELFGLAEGDRILSPDHPLVRCRAPRSASQFFPAPPHCKDGLNVLVPGVDRNFHNFLGAHPPSSSL